MIETVRWDLKQNNQLNRNFSYQIIGFEPIHDAMHFVLVSGHVSQLNNRFNFLAILS